MKSFLHPNLIRSSTVERGAARLTSTLLRQAPATVVVIFIVDEMVECKIQSPTHDESIFRPLTLAAIKQWKFEPKVQGRSVSGRLRQSFSFEQC